MTQRVAILGFNEFSYNGRLYHPNPAGTIAEMLDGNTVGDVVLVGVPLEVSKRGVERAKEVLDRVDAAVGLGLYSPGTRFIRVEVVAVNALRENDGVKPVDGNDPLYSVERIPVDPMLASSILSHILDAKPSVSTGLYYCNALAYTLYKWSRLTGKPSAFLHVPWSTQLSMRLGINPSSIGAVPLTMLAEAVAVLASRLPSLAGHASTPRRLEPAAPR